jgi:hypothetical protein
MVFAYGRDHYRITTFSIIERLFWFVKMRLLRVHKTLQRVKLTDRCLTQRAPEPRQRTPGLAWWESARFQAVCVAWS